MKCATRIGPRKVLTRNAFGAHALEVLAADDRWQPASRRGLAAVGAAVTCSTKMSCRLRLHDLEAADAEARGGLAQDRPGVHGAVGHAGSPRSGRSRSPSARRAGGRNAPWPWSASTIVFLPWRRLTSLTGPVGGVPGARGGGRDGVAEALDRLHLVAGEHDRLVLAAQVHEQRRAIDVHPDGIEPGERLVEDEDVRFVGAAVAMNWAFCCIPLLQLVVPVAAALREAECARARA